MKLEYIDISKMSKTQVKELDRDMKRSSLPEKPTDWSLFNPEEYPEGPPRSIIKIMKMFDDALLTRN